MYKNVYDFDKTIYNGDSTQNFYLFLLKRQPQIMLFLPYQGFFFILFALKIISKTSFKQKFYSCFKAVKDIENEVNIFWDKNKSSIKKWYLKNQKEDDIIISASPEFLLKPICKILNITNLIASRVDSKTGKYDGENCYGSEKVVRLRANFPNVKIDEFYSDSYSDQPLASLAKSPFLVVGDELYNWEEYKKGNKILKN